MEPGTSLLRNVGFHNHQNHSHMKLRCKPRHNNCRLSRHLGKTAHKTVSRIPICIQLYVYYINVANIELSPTQSPPSYIHHTYLVWITKLYMGRLFIVTVKNMIHLTFFKPNPYIISNTVSSVIHTSGCVAYFVAIPICDP